MHDDSTSDHYAAHVKPGDAVETPDGEVWVVERVDESELALRSALRDEHGTIAVDHYQPVRTVVPSEYVTKVADARQVNQ